MTAKTTCKKYSQIDSTTKRNFYTLSLFIPWDDCCL